MQRLQQACAVFLLDSVANHQNENDYNEIFISILAHESPINLNINCYYAIKITETIK
jgi:hypothetical protein